MKGKTKIVERERIKERKERRIKEEKGMRNKNGEWKRRKIKAMKSLDRNKKKKKINEIRGQNIACKDNRYLHNYKRPKSRTAETLL